MSSEHTEWDRIKTLQRFFALLSWVYGAVAIIVAGVSFWVPIVRYHAIILVLVFCHARTMVLAQERFAYYQAQIDMMRLHRGENIS